VGKEVLVSFGRQVAVERRKIGLSQEALAARAGIHRTYVGAVERGERNISLLNIHKLADALGVEAGVLVAPFRVN
jgi:transcriptional regulator with XRE-family HTH domain